MALNKSFLNKCIQFRSAEEFTKSGILDTPEVDITKADRDFLMKQLHKKAFLYKNYGSSIIATNRGGSMEWLITKHRDCYVISVASAGNALIFPHYWVYDTGRSNHYW